MPLDDIAVFRKSTLVRNFRILEFRFAFDSYRLKARFFLVNSWILDFFEHAQLGRRLYAYHVFSDSKLDVRWDNAPHHRSVRTFPHHKHVNNTVIESKEMTASLVLKEVAELIK